MQDLSAGYLKPVLDRVKSDQTLMLAIRDGYINVYYRGGSLLKLEEQKQREMGYASGRTHECLVFERHG